MTRYLLVRLYSMALTLFGLSLLVFLMLRLVPGTVVEQMIGADAIVSPAMVAELKRFFGDKLCATTIPRNIRLAEAPSHGKAALVYDPRSKGAESYIRLAKEIIGHYGPAELGVQAPVEQPAAEMDKSA